MGLLMDIRSGKRNQFGLGAYAIVFWTIAGVAVGGGGGAYLAGGLDETPLVFGLIGGVVGVCIDSYAAMGRSKLALAAPAIILAMVC
jgi:hypothetical protein